MSLYLVKVSWTQPYPKQSDYRIAGSSFATASGRAIRMWRKENPRKQVNEVTLKIVKV